MPSQIRDTSRLCIHSITHQPWPIETTIEQLSARSVGAITVWRQVLEGHSVSAIATHIRVAGLKVISLCRGGFFPATDISQQQRAIDDNRKAIDQAAELGAPLLVLVPGAHPSQSLHTSRQQIVEGIAAILPHAAACDVRLGIEALHPMYADTRSAINTLRQANELCAQFNSPSLGVVVDVYHLWWDPDLQVEIQRAGDTQRIFAYHICDWKSPTTDLLNDRGLMGEGCIPLRQIRTWIENSGFDGFHEVEIFSNHYWAMDQEVFLERIIQAYLGHS